MTISEHLTEFGGFNVVDWTPAPERLEDAKASSAQSSSAQSSVLGDPARTIHRIAVEYDEESTWTDKFRVFLAQSGVEQTQGLIVGMWASEAGESELAAGMVEALVGASAKLPHLRALFIGDITGEENEISWITQADLSPVLAAYPDLTHLGIRGGNELSLGTVRLPELRELIIQAGGLSAEVVRQVVSAELPNLEHLELYLGTDDYGATSAPDDLSPLLSADHFPKLKYLGLKNSDHQDAIAQMFAQAPVLDRLETLDLSMGVLTDDGGAALLGSERIRQLKKLDLSHHFMSDGMMKQLGALGVPVDLSEQQESEEDDWRFVALGE